ncbi:hypothetical protein JYB64_25010, partial [Algoriphagus aestuarii]|nr:hypothetical protein [Algoriphagus aestuarii]
MIIEANEKKELCEMKVVCKLEEILAEKEEEGTKITKAEIARQLGISKQAMTNIARGKTEPK